MSGGSRDERGDISAVLPTPKSRRSEIRGQNGHSRGFFSEFFWGSLQHSNCRVDDVGRQGAMCFHAVRIAFEIVGGIPPNECIGISWKPSQTLVLQGFARFFRERFLAGQVRCANRRAGIIRAMPRTEFVGTERRRACSDRRVWSTSRCAPEQQILVFVRWTYSDMSAQRSDSEEEIPT